MGNIKSGGIDFMSNTMGEIQISVDTQMANNILRWIERDMLEMNLLFGKSKLSEFLRLKELKEQIKTKLKDTYG